MVREQQFPQLRMPKKYEYFKLLFVVGAKKLKNYFDRSFRKVPNVVVVLAPTHLKSEFSWKVIKILEKQKNCGKSKKSWLSKNFFPFFWFSKNFLECQEFPNKRLRDFWKKNLLFRWISPTDLSWLGLDHRQDP